MNAGQKRIGRCQDPLGHSYQMIPVLYSTPFQKITTETPVHYFINQVQRVAKYPQFLVHESAKISRVNKNAISLCFHIRQDGVLLYHDLKSNWVEVPPTEYCVNGFQRNGSTPDVSYQNILDGEENIGVFMSMRAESHETSVMKKNYAIFYGSAFFVASVFLLVTFVVYCLLWKEQKLQGWTTMSHTITMFFLYIFRGLNYFLELRASNIGRAYRSTACTGSGISTHYFFLSNFCWLTVVCFSLFWTFRGINVGGPHSKEVGQYLLYALFGWGLPFLFVTVSVVLDQKYSYEPCNMVTVPEYGIGTCSVSIGALGPYKYYPVAILLCLNLVFFSMTFYKLNEYKKSASRASKILKGNKQLFQVITKLFFVMGFTWSFELILWCWWWLSGAERKWFRAITNLINCLLAIAIFIIYVCKSNVANSLKKEYPGLAWFINTITMKSEASGTVLSTSMEFERKNGKTQRNQDVYN
ncbi:unnamed protein product [Allacma fusca]|uniref:G-protein coupled receptors family 2 profile 2 domain-containing protein n=1 Tax=Allacma fusca TaxID=39272 RepID=A0A8J2JII2_9HEXA|nr:unnamed protein product [Allacma fusca]